MKIKTLGAGPGLTKTSGLNKSLPGEKRRAVMRDGRAEASQWQAVGYAGKQMTDISLRMQQLDNVRESNDRKVAMKAAVNDLETEIASGNEFIANPKAIAGFYRERMDKIRERTLDGANKPVADHVGYAFDMYRTETDPRIDNQIRQRMIKNATDQMWQNLDASKALLLNTETDKSLQDTLDRVPGFIADVRQQIDDGVQTGLIDPAKQQALFDATISETTKSSYMQLIPEYPQAMNELLNGQKKEEFLKNLSPPDRTAVRNAARTAFKNFKTDSEGMEFAASLRIKYTKNGVVDTVAAASDALNVNAHKDKWSEGGYKAGLAMLQAAAAEDRRVLGEYKEAETNRFFQGQDPSTGTRSQRLQRAIDESRDPRSMVPKRITYQTIATLTQNKERSPSGVDAAWTRYLATPEKQRDHMKFRHEWAAMHFQDSQELEKRAAAHTNLEGGQNNYMQLTIDQLDKRNIDPREKLEFITALERGMKVSGLTAKDADVVKLADQLHKGKVESDMAKFFDKLGDVGQAAKGFFTDRTLKKSAPLYKSIDRLVSQGDEDIADNLIRSVFDKNIPDATTFKRDYVDAQIATNHKGEQLKPEELDALQIKYYQDIHNATKLGEATNMPDITTTLPDGREVSFEGGPHTYHVGDQELTSTTTVLKNQFPQFDVEIKSAEAAKNRGVTQEEIKRQWEQTGFEARQWGNKYHEKAMGITGMLTPENTPEAGNEKEHRAFVGLEQHFEKVLGDSTEGGWKVVGQEQILANPEAKVAGTADLILEKDGIIKIVDLKTSKELEFRGAEIIRGNTVMAGLKNTKMNQYKAQLGVYKSMYLSQNPDAKVTLELWRANAEGAVEIHDMNNKNMDKAVTALLNQRLEANGQQPLPTAAATKREFMVKGQPFTMPKHALSKPDKLGPAARANQ